MDKKTIFKFWFISLEKTQRGLYLNFGRSAWICLTKLKAYGLFLWHVTKNRTLEAHFHLFTDDKSFRINSFVGRYCDHHLFVFQFNFFKLLCLDIFFDDAREWDYYKNKRTYEIYDYYNNTTLTHPIGEKPCYKLRKEKAKWYLNTQYLKIYNLDWLNDPWGLTFDFALFPLLRYIKLNFRHDKRSWADFNLSLQKEQTTGLTFNFTIGIFSRFFEFEIGENTIIRDANTYFLEDFRTLQQFGADPYFESEYADNIVLIQLNKRNLAFLYGLFEWYGVNPKYFDTDEILMTAAYKYNYRKEIFDYLTSKINYIKDWQEFEKDRDDYFALNEEAYKKLETMKDTPIQELPEKPEKDSRFRWPFGLRVHLSKRLSDLFSLLFTMNDFWVFRFDLRFPCDSLEINSYTNFTRDFGIRFYLLSEYPHWKNFSVNFFHNDFYLFGVHVSFFGIWFTWTIGARTSDPNYNFKKQRPVTIEEEILVNSLGKDPDWSAPVRRKKYKEFLNNRLIKIYNSNYLNCPYGRSLEFQLPLGHYLRFSFNREVEEYKKQTEIMFNLNCDNKNKDDNKIKFGLTLFKHYFTISFSKNKPIRFSNTHSLCSLKRFDLSKLSEEEANDLLLSINENETYIIKRLVNHNLPLEKVDFNELICHFGFRHFYHKPTLDYILDVAKESGARFYVTDELKNASNDEILKQLNEWSSDFTKPVLVQLTNYIKNQKDMSETDTIES